MPPPRRAYNLKITKSNKSDKISRINNHYFIVSIKTKGSGTSYKAKKRECTQNPEF
jgi:hypothetical protein